MLTFEAAAHIRLATHTQMSDPRADLDYHVWPITLGVCTDAELTSDRDNQGMPTAPRRPIPPQSRQTDPRRRSRLSTGANTSPDIRESPRYGRWHLAVDAAFNAGIAAFLVISTGTCACRLRGMGLLTQDEFAAYLALPLEVRLTWEDIDLLELARVDLA
jgi:hypothetical protein